MQRNVDFLREDRELVQQFCRNNYVTIGKDTIHPRYGPRYQTRKVCKENCRTAPLVDFLQTEVASFLEAEQCTGFTLGAMCRYEDVCTEPGKRRVMRPVIEVPGRIITRINPDKIETTMIMHIRPGWKDLRDFIRGPPDDNGGCASCTVNGRVQQCCAVVYGLQCTTSIAMVRPAVMTLQSASIGSRFSRPSYLIAQDDAESRLGHVQVATTLRRVRLHSS